MSKMQQSYEIIREVFMSGSKQPRKDSLDRIVKELGMSMMGASTYFANCMRSVRDQMEQDGVKDASIDKMGAYLLEQAERRKKEADEREAQCQADLAEIRTLLEGMDKGDIINFIVQHADHLYDDSRETFLLDLQALTGKSGE